LNQVKFDQYLTKTDVVKFAQASRTMKMDLNAMMRQMKNVAIVKMRDENMRLREVVVLMATGLFHIADAGRDEAPEDSEFVTLLAEQVTIDMQFAFDLARIAELFHPITRVQWLEITRGRGQRVTFLPDRDIQDMIVAHLLRKN
jgi:hypothetical protein